MAQTNVKLNMPILSVEKAVETLGQAYCSVIGKGLSPKVLPSVMLWGPPGVGKSQAVRQIGERIEEETGKRVTITDVRLLLFNPIDLRGIPTANEDKTLAVWLKPQIFQMDDGDDVINLLFLDEISAAPQSVQASAYQITLDRVVGEHKLPDNCIVIAAGNRVTDRSVAYKMPKALANRLLHIEVQGNFDSWFHWAVKKGINSKVLAYLSFRRDCLFGFSTDNDDLAFATPRTWEMVSNVLNTVGEDFGAVGPLVSGLIGNGLAIEFKNWCRIYADLPKTEDIFAGKTRVVPKETDKLYAVVTGMIAYAKDHSDDHDGMGRSIQYAEHLPAEFARMLTQGYSVMKPNYHQILATLPEYRELCRKRGVMLNGRA